MDSKKTFGNTPKKEPVKPRGILKDVDKVEPKKRTGRPPKPKNEERATEKLSAYFTPSEMEKIREKAGMVKLATHLRAALHDLGYFK